MKTMTGCRMGVIKGRSVCAAHPLLILWNVFSILTRSIGTELGDQTVADSDQSGQVPVPPPQSH